ncbi:MAG: hypothetical protein JSV88_01470, partial [Candidatus Aminicenantes bacterium]
MKKNILVLISAVLLMTGSVFAEAIVQFDRSFVDFDVSVIKESYKGKLPNLGFFEADAIAQKILTYTGAAYYLDDLNPMENSLVYKSSGNDG